MRAHAGDRRDGRAVEGTSLENWHGRKSIVGSNPTLSAQAAEHASISMTADRYGHLFPRGDDGAELAAAEKAFLG